MLPQQFSDIRNIQTVINDLNDRFDKIERRLEELDAVGSSSANIFAKIYRSTDQTITTGATWTSISFDSITDDTDSMFSIASPTRLTIVTKGKFKLRGGVLFDANVTGYRGVQILKNGVDILGQTQIGAPGSGDCSISATDEEILIVGDYIELQVRQTSGGDLDVKANNFSPVFSAYRYV